LKEQEERAVVCLDEFDKLFEKRPDGGDSGPYIGHPKGTRRPRIEESVATGATRRQYDLDVGEDNILRITQ
jgi:hypothetical protein